MARTFEALVRLVLNDQMSPQLNKSGANIRRELDYMEKGFRRVNEAGFGMLAGFTGLVALTSGFRKLSDTMVEMSRAMNELAAAATKMTSSGKLVIFSEADKDATLKRIIEVSRALNLSPKAIFADVTAASKAGAVGEQIPGAAGALSKIFKSQSISPGETERVARNIIFSANDVRLPMQAAVIEDTLSKFGEQIARISRAFGTTVPEITEAFKYGGPSLQAGGFSVEQILSMIGVGAKHGITGSQFGVWARQLEATVSHPTAKGMAELERLGVLNAPQEGLTGDAKKDKLIKERNAAAMERQFNEKYNYTVTEGGMLLRENLQKQFPQIDFMHLGDAANAEINKTAHLTNLEERHAALKSVVEKYAPGESENSQERIISNLMRQTFSHIEGAKLMRDVTEHGGDLAAWVKLIGSRQSGRSEAIAQSIIEAMMAERSLKVGTIGGPGMDSERPFTPLMDEQIRQLNLGPAGAMDRLEAAFGRLATEMSKGFFADTFTRAINKFADIMDDLQVLVRDIKVFFHDNPEVREKAEKAMQIAGYTLLGTGAAWVAGMGSRALRYGLSGFSGASAAAAGGAGGAAGAVEGAAGGVLGWLRGAAGGMLPGRIFSPLSILRGGMLGAIVGPTIEAFVKDVLADTSGPGGMSDPIGMMMRKLGIPVDSGGTIKIGPAGGPALGADIRHRFGEILQQGGPDMSRKGNSIYGDPRAKGWRLMADTAGHATEAAASALIEMTYDFDQIALRFTDLVKKAAEASAALRSPADLFSMGMAPMSLGGGGFGGGGWNGPDVGGTVRMSGRGGRHRHYLGHVMRAHAFAGAGGGIGGGGGGGRHGLGRGGRNSIAHMAPAYMRGRAHVGGLMEVAAAGAGIPMEGLAFLDTLKSWETPGEPNFGYNTMFGSRQFSDMSRHPGGPGVHTDAGRYQFLLSTWRGVLKAHPDIHGFGRDAQDKGAWYHAQDVYRRLTHRSLLTDLQSGDPDTVARIGRVLHGTWVSTRPDFANIYRRGIQARRTPMGASGVGSGLSPSTGRRMERDEPSSVESHEPVAVKTEVHLDKQKVAESLNKFLRRPGRRMPSDIHAF